MARATTDPASVVVALSSFDGAIGSTVIRVRQGDIFAADDPAVRKWPTLFSALTVRRTAPTTRVESATAGPGEKRGA